MKGTIHPPGNVTRPAGWQLAGCAFVLLLASCLPEPDLAIDQATVLGDNTPVRIDASASSRTQFILDSGDRVDIVSKRGSWYLIRDFERIEGWMEEATLIRDATRDTMRDALVVNRERPLQNTATAIDTFNLRMAPGRDSDVIRRHRRGTTLEVLDHAATPRPDSDATDVWFLVRPSREEIGWVFSQLIEFDAPEAIRPFMEERTYPAAHRLKTVEDPLAGPMDWYVVAERRRNADPQFAFDGIRVFIWDIEEHRYETTLRLRNLRGLMPLERTGDELNPGFRFHVRGADGAPVAREYVMRETLPRAVR